LSVEKMIEDRCVQIMHISPYLREPESINKLLKFVEVNSFTVNGLHHEIYLSDPRKTDPEKLTTIISYPFIMRQKHKAFRVCSYFKSRTDKVFSGPYYSGFCESERI